MSRGARVVRPTAEFRAEYGAHRASEGRQYDDAALLALPYLEHGPLANQWAIRARTFDAFLHAVLRPAAARAAAPLRLIDLGAGNGWLCYRSALEGHHAVAVDIRADEVDGLGAAEAYLHQSRATFARVMGSFEELPFRDRSFDIAVFNASLHYALDLREILNEAARVVRSGGTIAILDSPFYTRESDGVRMVTEKRRDAERRFGDRAAVLLALPFIEFLTVPRLEAASAGLHLRWRRHRVRYPLRYEIRPLVARLKGARRPSRFDLWDTTVP